MPTHNACWPKARACIQACFGGFLALLHFHLGCSTRGMHGDLCAPAQFWCPAFGTHQHQAGTHPVLVSRSWPLTMNRRPSAVLMDVGYQR